MVALNFVFWVCLGVIILSLEFKTPVFGFKKRPLAKDLQFFYKGAHTSLRER